MFIFLYFEERTVDERGWKRYDAQFFENGPSKNNDSENFFCNENNQFDKFSIVKVNIVSWSEIVQNKQFLVHPVPKFFLGLPGLPGDKRQKYFWIIKTLKLVKISFKVCMF